MLPQENEAVINKFLQQQEDAIEKKINAEWGIEVNAGRQILPTPNNGMDGFYYCKLQKVVGEGKV